MRKAKNNVPSPNAVKTIIKAHVSLHGGRSSPFVDVHMIPGEKEHVYVITTETGIALKVQNLLESRLRRKCPYANGAFLVYESEIDELSRLP
jgi:hypothetical protein